VHPVLTVVELGPRSLPIGSYGVMLVLAIAIAALAVVGSAQRSRQNPGDAIAAVGIALAGALLGASALQALVVWSRTGSLLTALTHPGLVFFGGALGAALGFGVSARAFGLDAVVIAARAIPGLLLAHAVGRLGCLLGGCCYGRRADGWYALRYDSPLGPAHLLGSARHPWPLYEAAGLLLLALGFALFAHGAPRRRLWSYVALYSLLRLGLEPLRGDAIRGLFATAAGAVSTSQLIALALLCLALWRLLGLRRSAA